MLGQGLVSPKWIKVNFCGIIENYYAIFVCECFQCYHDSKNHNFRRGNADRKEYLWKVFTFSNFWRVFLIKGWTHMTSCYVNEGRGGEKGNKNMTSYDFEKEKKNRGKYRVNVLKISCVKFQYHMTSYVNNLFKHPSPILNHNSKSTIIESWILKLGQWWIQRYPHNVFPFNLN